MAIKKHRPPTLAVRTILFTDIEGWTKARRKLGAHEAATMEVHDAAVRESMKKRGGKQIGLSAGDSFFYLFWSASDAVLAAVEAQEALARAAWPSTPYRVRIGMHSGEIHTPLEAIDFPVTIAARIMSVAHGGQVLLSESTNMVARPSLPSEVVTESLGLHQLKDIDGMLAIYQASRRGEDARFGPLSTVRPTNVAKPYRRLIDRVAVLRAIRSQLTDSRVVTIWGSPGVGKSRLAHEVAYRALDSFPGGVRLVRLADVFHARDIPDAIAASFGIPAGAGRSLEQVVQHIAGRRTLIVLDNMEQVLDGTEHVRSLLDASPELRVLITSQWPTNLAVEQLVPLDTFQHLESPDGETASPTDAAEWFIEAARRMKRGYAANLDELSDIEAICSKLDGHALSIEIVASRIDLTVPELRRRVDRGDLDLGPIDDAADRRKLRGAVNWTYQLLTADGQRFVRILSPFLGADAEAVDAAWTGAGQDGSGVAYLTRELMPGPLIRLETRQSRDLRFSMLFAIRQFALEQLRMSGEEDAARLVHAQHYAAFAKKADGYLSRDDSLLWLRRFEDEHANIQAAMDWCLAQGRRALAVELAVETSWFWILHSHLEVALRCLDAVLGDTTGVAALTVAPAYARSGNVERVLGNLNRAEQRYSEAIEVATPIGHAFTLAYAKNGLGRVAMSRGQFPVARELLAEALRIREEAPVPLVGGMAVSLDNLGDVELLEKGDLDAAREKYLRAQTLRMDVGGNRPDIPGGYVSLLKLGILRIREPGGQMDGQRLVTDALRGLHRIGYRQWIPDCLEALAEVAHMLGDADRAARLWGAADRLVGDLGLGFSPLEEDRKGAARVENQRTSGMPAWTALAAEGRTMEPEMAVAYALNQNSPGTSASPLAGKATRQGAPQSRRTVRHPS